MSERMNSLIYVNTLMLEFHTVSKCLLDSDAHADLPFAGSMVLP